MDNALQIKDIFAQMIRNKMQYKLARHIWARTGADLKDWSAEYHYNGMMLLCFTARCKTYGYDGTYIVFGHVSDTGEVTIDNGE